MSALMRDDDEEHLKSNLEHARWRVGFLRCMLESHRLLPWQDNDWLRKESEYLRRLIMAQGQLDCLESL